MLLTLVLASTGMYSILKLIAERQMGEISLLQYEHNIKPVCKYSIVVGEEASYRVCPTYDNFYATN